MVRQVLHSIAVDVMRCFDKIAGELCKGSFSQRFVLEPQYDETETVRIKVTCSQCGALLVANAADIHQ